MKTEWTVVAERVRERGDVSLNALLDKYYRKLFGCAETCWVFGARKFIERRARELGILEV